MDESMSAGGMSAQGAETVSSAPMAESAAKVDSGGVTEQMGEPTPAEVPASAGTEQTGDGAATTDDFESRVKESDVYKALEEQAKVHEAENVALRLQRDEDQIHRAANQRMAEDLQAIRAIDPTVGSLESLAGYYELAERGITGADAYHILRGRADVENRGAALKERADRQMAEDLQAIRAIDPTVKSLESLAGYYELAERGITGVDAYHVLEGRKAVTARLMPPSTGAVRSNEGEPEIRPDQLDELTRADLKNDRTYKKALRALSKLNPNQIY